MKTQGEAMRCTAKLGEKIDQSYWSLVYKAEKNNRKNTARNTSWTRPQKATNNRSFFFFLFNPLECVHTWDMINVLFVGVENLKTAGITVLGRGRTGENNTKGI